MNPMVMMMLSSLIQQNPTAFNKAKEMCNGKSENEMQQIFMNLAQTQGRDTNELNQIASMFGINLGGK